MACLALKRFLLYRQFYADKLMFRKGDRATDGFLNWIDFSLVVI